MEQFAHSIKFNNVVPRAESEAASRQKHGYELERARTDETSIPGKKEGGRFGKLSLLSALSIGDIFNMITEWFNFWLSDTSSTYCT